MLTARVCTLLAIPLHCSVGPGKLLFTRRALFFSSALLLSIVLGLARPSSKTQSRDLHPSPAPSKKVEQQDDSLLLVPPKDLTLQPGAARKADALAQFVEGERWEELGEMENALNAYQKVLNVDPGQVELATHVAALLTRQDDYPHEIDVLKDAIKANPKESGPYLQLAAIYAKKKNGSSAESTLTGAPLDAKTSIYQRLYEIEVAVGHPQKALEALDRAFMSRAKPDVLGHSEDFRVAF